MNFADTQYDCLNLVAIIVQVAVIKCGFYLSVGTKALIVPFAERYCMSYPDFVLLLNPSLTSSI